MVQHIYTHQSGLLFERIWVIHGDKKRSDKYNLNGTIKLSELFEDGEYHSEIGPARNIYDIKGLILTESYFLFGALYSREEWLRQLDRD